MNSQCKIIAIFSLAVIFTSLPVQSALARSGAAHLSVAPSYGQRHHRSNRNYNSSNLNHHSNDLNRHNNRFNYHSNHLNHHSNDQHHKNNHYRQRSYPYWEKYSHSSPHGYSPIKRGYKYNRHKRSHPAIYGYTFDDHNHRYRHGTDRSYHRHGKQHITFSGGVIIIP